jgi:hypothetical protein
MLAALNGGRLVTEAYDYIGVAYPEDDTEVYTYKKGGSDGTTVATVTVEYTDSTKENVSSVARTSRVSQFLVLSPVRGSRGHAGHVWVVDASICVKGFLASFGVSLS